MKNALKLSVLFSLILFLFSSCEEFPAFEGTYTGTLTITYQVYNYPVESSITIVIERDFKDIASDYSGTLGTFTLSGRIDNKGKFSVSQTGITDNNQNYVITDIGTINLALGTYTSTITITEEGVTTVTGTLSLTN